MISEGVVVFHCPSCFGALYETEDLGVPLNAAGSKPSGCACPRCRKPMETLTAYEGMLEVDRCTECAALWFDAGELQILRRLSGKEDLVKKRAAAAKPAGATKKTTMDEPAPVPPEMSGMRNIDEIRSPTIELDGRVYHHFQTSVPVTTSVLGEFPWIAKVGDTARMRDFISPPYLLSHEVAEKESTWSAGEYLEPEEVWTAFALPGSPPPKTGVSPAQPNPWADQVPSILVSFALAAAACVGAYLYFASTASQAAVFEGGFSVAAAEPERSRVTEVFEVKGRVSNLQVKLDTNLDGQWASIGMALIDADTDRALDFGRDLSYYHGYEDGESWSEGSARSTFYVPSVHPGRYYLRVEPETDSPALSFRVAVTRDVPLTRLPLIALALLALPVVWAVMRRDAFEGSRWMESDHPRSSAGDDDEDDE